MTLQGSSWNSPDEDGRAPLPRREGERVDEPHATLEELLLLGEQHYLAETGARRTPAQRAWLRRAAAVVRASGERPVLTLVTMALVVASTLVFINELAPQAMPEVCSTMVALVMAEFALLFRQRRSAAIAG